MLCNSSLPTPIEIERQFVVVALSVAVTAAAALAVALVVVVTTAAVHRDTAAYYRSNSIEFWQLIKKCTGNGFISITHYSCLRVNSSQIAYLEYHHELCTRCPKSLSIDSHHLKQQ